MIFTEEWLRQYVNPALGTDELADALTMAYHCAGLFRRRSG